MAKLKLTTKIAVVTSLLFLGLFATTLMGCQISNTENKKPEITPEQLEPLYGYGQTPPTGGSGRIYFLYLDQNMTSQEGELIAQSKYEASTGEADEVADDGKITFHVSYPEKETSYIYNPADGKITSDERNLVSVQDGKTTLPFYMTKTDKPEGESTGPN